METNGLWWHGMSTPIGIFYGSTTCYTEMVAEQIFARLGPEKATLHNIADTPISKCQEYDYLIFGIPTWDYGELQEDWENIWDDIADLNLSGKTAAIFGLGDQVGYPEWFQDAMGYLYHLLSSLGAELTGHWPDLGYEYAESKALTEDGMHFVGLSLDDENQADLTEDRITKWLGSIGFCSDS
jgi:flavodoxin II